MPLPLCSQKGSHYLLIRLCVRLALHSWLAPSTLWLLCWLEPKVRQPPAPEGGVHTSPHPRSITLILRQHQPEFWTHLSHISNIHIQFIWIAISSLWLLYTVAGLRPSEPCSSWFSSVIVSLITETQTTFPLSPPKNTKRPYWQITFTCASCQLLEQTSIDFHIALRIRLRHLSPSVLYLLPASLIVAQSLFHSLNFTAKSLARSVHRTL